MKKTLYIIPGWQETCKRKPYKTLGENASKKGYEIEFVKVDWKKKLSLQIFPVSSKDIIFGFSLGAILAHLVVQKYECQKIILASMTPLENFKDTKKIKELKKIIGAKITKDIEENIKTKLRAKKQFVLYGQKELDDEEADIVVPNTGHSLSENYLREINKLI